MYVFMEMNQSMQLLDKCIYSFQTKPHMHSIVKFNYITSMICIMEFFVEIHTLYAGTLTCVITIYLSMLGHKTVIFRLSYQDVKINSP